MRIVDMIYKINQTDSCSSYLAKWWGGTKIDLMFKTQIKKLEMYVLFI